MLRALSLDEITCVSGGVMATGDEYVVDNDNDGYDGGYDGGDGGFNDGDTYGAAGDGTDTSDQDGTTGPDIVVTAPFSKSQLDQMNQEAIQMAAVELHTINTGVSVASYIAGLGAAGSAAVGLGTSIATDQAAQSLVQQKFDYIYRRDMAIQNGTAHYGNGYPALQIP